MITHLDHMRTSVPLDKLSLVLFVQMILLN